MQKSFIGIVENDKGIDGQKMPLKAIVCRRENENSSITTGAFGVEKSACASRVLFLRADGESPLFRCGFRQGVFRIFAHEMT